MDVTNCMTSMRFKRIHLVHGSGETFLGVVFLEWETVVGAV